MVIFSICLRLVALFQMETVAVLSEEFKGSQTYCNQFNAVATIGLQGFSPKLAKGELAALSGAVDNARYFQISVPVQPGKVGVQALACWCGGGTR